MTYYLTYLKDIAGNNYIGLKVYKDLVNPFLNELEDILEDEFEVFTNNQKNRDHGSHHITVINVAEYNMLSKKLGVSSFVNSLEEVFKYPIDDLKLMGIGSASRNDNTAYFIVCQSDNLKSIRDRYDLPNLDFHITLGFNFKDVFGVRKNQVLEKKSKFLKLLAIEFLKKENFEFIKNIDNYEEDKDIEIIPISLDNSYIKIKVGDYLMDIGYLEIENKLWIFTKYKDENNSKRIPLTEIIQILKNNKL